MDSRKEEKPYIPHYEILRLIGEIDGVSMNGECDIFLHMKGKKIRIIKDDGSDDGLFVDRNGIAEQILKQLYTNK